MSRAPEDIGCREFPSKLKIIEEAVGDSVIAIDAGLSYSFLNNVLAEQLGPGTTLQVPSATAEIKGISLAPFGTSLLATVEGSFRETILFGARVEGTLFFVLEPSLDQKRQVITISQVEIEATSDHALGKIAAGVLSVLAGAIEERLTHLTFDLKPLAEREKDRVSQALMQLPNEGDAFVFSNADISDIRLEQLRVDDSGILILFLVRGRLAVEVTSIPLGPR